MKEIKEKFFMYVSLNIMGMMAVSCYILADTFFVSKALGELGLASLNFSISIFSIMQGIGLMIGIGGATYYSINKEKYNKSNTAFTHSLVIGICASAMFIIVAIFFSEPLSRLLGADESTLSFTKTYLMTILSFSPFFIFNNILLAFVRNDNNPKLSMIAMIFSSLSNIILDYIFMFIFSMGIFGAAFATAISPIISLGILSIHFIRKRNTFYIIKEKISIKKIKKILNLGTSSLIIELTSAISLIVFNLIILGIEGNTGVAAYGIVANISLIATAIFVGIGQGIQPLASEYYGKANKLYLNKILYYSILTTIIFSGLIYIFIYFFTNEIIYIFNSDNNKLLILASNGMKIYFLGYIFAGINIVSAALFSSVSNSKQGMIISILRSCFFLIPLVFIFSTLFKMNGVWFSFVITEILVFIIDIILLGVIKNKWAKFN